MVAASVSLRGDGARDTEELADETRIPDAVLLVNVLRLTRGISSKFVYVDVVCLKRGTSSKFMPESFRECGTVRNGNVTF